MACEAAVAGAHRTQTRVQDVVQVQHSMMQVQPHAKPRAAQRWAKHRAARGRASGCGQSRTCMLATEAACERREAVLRTEPRLESLAALLPLRLCRRGSGVCCRTRHVRERVAPRRYSTRRDGGGGSSYSTVRAACAGQVLRTGCDRCTECERCEDCTGCKHADASRSTPAYRGAGGCRWRCGC